MPLLSRRIIKWYNNNEKSTRDICMAKTNRPRRRMDKYFKNLQRNAYILSYNKKGSCTTKIKKWDVIRKLTKKLVAEDEQTGRLSKESRSLDPGVQLLPRQDVVLYGTIPAMEQRVYSKCKNCSRVFNPRDILSHRSCSKSHTPHSGLLKKKVKSKSSNSKKTPIGCSASDSTNSNSSLVMSSASPSVKDPVKEFEFKRPYTPPPIKAASSSAGTSMPQLKISVTKIGLSKSSKPASVTTSASTSPSTTSSDRTDCNVSSSKASSSFHHSTKSSSTGHYNSKSSSGHSPRNPSSSSGHHSPKSPSTHHSPRSPSYSSSQHRSKSPSSSQYSPRSPSKSSSSSSSHHGASHHSSSSSHHSSKSSSSKSTPMDTLPPSSSSHHHHSSSSSSHSSNRHKKSSNSSSSKRSSNTSSSSISSSSIKILPKNYDPDIHCGVIEGNRGPCMRSITCSNHRLHLRKQVSGRSKAIHQLIAERKAAKENDLKLTNPPCSYTSPNGEAKEVLNQNTPYVPVVGQVASSNTDSTVTNSFVPIMPRTSTHQAKLTTSVLSKVSNSTEIENESAKALTIGYISRAKNIENTQDNVVGTVPVVIMPVSPVSVVSSVQLLKIGNNIISLELPQSATNPLVKKKIILPIPNNYSGGVRMYKSHPKPVILPKFGARRLGGAIMLGNPLLEDQRNDLLTTIDFKLETANIERGLSGLNHSNTSHRPNILKGKGGNKTNYKRPASDKLATGDSKRLVPDVNGFILHADVSETADAPQYSGENGPSQHELIISLIDKYGF